jgi:hypothetical protein
MSVHGLDESEVHWHRGELGTWNGDSENCYTLRESSRAARKRRKAAVARIPDRASELGDST